MPAAGVLLSASSGMSKEGTRRVGLSKTEAALMPHHPPAVLVPKLRAAMPIQREVTLVKWRLRRGQTRRQGSVLRLAGWEPWRLGTPGSLCFVGIP